jgi:hypothetical protein
MTALPARICATSAAGIAAGLDAVADGIDAAGIGGSDICALPGHGRAQRGAGLAFRPRNAPRRGAVYLGLLALPGVRLRPKVTVAFFLVSALVSVVLAPFLYRFVPSASAFTPGRSSPA